MVSRSGVVMAEIRSCQTRTASNLLKKKEISEWIQKVNFIQTVSPKCISTKISWTLEGLKWIEIICNMSVISQWQAETMYYSTRFIYFALFQYPMLFNYIFIITNRKIYYRLSWNSEVKCQSMSSINDPRKSWQNNAPRKSPSQLMSDKNVWKVQPKTL